MAETLSSSPELYRGSKSLWRSALQVLILLSLDQSNETASVLVYLSSPGRLGAVTQNLEVCRWVFFASVA